MVVNVFPFCRVSSLKGSLDDDLPWLGPWEGEETDSVKTPVFPDSSLGSPLLRILIPSWKPTHQKIDHMLPNQISVIG